MATATKRAPAPVPAATFVQPAAAVPAEPTTPAVQPPAPPATEAPEGLPVAASDDPFAGLTVYAVDAWEPPDPPVWPTVLNFVDTLIEHGAAVPVVEEWPTATVKLFVKQLKSKTVARKLNGRKLRITAGTVDGRAALKITLSAAPAEATAEEATA